MIKIQLKNMFNSSKIRIACLLFLLICHIAQFADSNTVNKFKFKTVVLDAGHGGHDSGCNGHTGSYEKTVTLAIVLKLGKMIEENFPDVKVVYTRKTDVFIPLETRAKIANDNSADVFISVHCNANPSATPSGTETYIMGLHKTDANLDVALRENSVIKLEDNYKATYNGFDPDSPEAMIVMSLAQNANLEQSSFLAGRIQHYFTNELKRTNRGVKQAGFWVLYRTTCPSVLIETGFLTNNSEEKYLISSAGQSEISTSIYKAFVDYKNAFEKGSYVIHQTDDKTNNTPTNNTNNNTNNTQSNNNQTTVTTINNSNSNNNTGSTNNNQTTNSNTSNTNTQQNQTSTNSNINVNTSNNQSMQAFTGVLFKVQFKATDNICASTDKIFQQLPLVHFEYVNGLYKYLSGPFDTYSKAKTIQTKAKNLGYKDAFIAVYKNGARLSFTEAKQYFK